MKHLKKSFMLVLLLAIIFGSQTFAQDLFSLTSAAKISKPIKADATTANNGERIASNIVFQSKDGGQTWQDISNSLPKNEQPEGFFAGESDVYLRVNNEMYHSKNNLITPIWEKDNALDPRCTSIAFNRSGVMAYNYDGQIFQKMPSTGAWLPMYANSKKKSMLSIFEASNGTVFLGCENGLYKSADKGRSWNQVLNQGWVMKLVESEGVLIGTSQNGIIRSADKGEHWEWVISEGGVGIDVERIDGGFAAISYNESTKSRRIRISLDSGKTWNAIDEGLPPSSSISSIKQIGKHLICGHPDGIFRSSDMGKTWSIVYPSFAFKISDVKVFTIYVSGNVLYAVARGFGC